MSDIMCAKCGEPWDSYGITWSVGDGDMTPEEAKKFKSGLGCPCCGFGDDCPKCNGRGKTILRGDVCQDCAGTGKRPTNSRMSLEALESLLESSDEEPLGLIENWEAE